MAFDWVGFLRGNGIEYLTEGAKTTRDHVNIRCPFCGSSDEGHHLGISTKGYGYNCWRNKAHSGKNPVRLVSALLGCDYGTAERIVNDDADVVPTVERLADSLRGLSLSGPKEREERLEFPREFHPLLNGEAMAQPFLAYLRQRPRSKRRYSWADVEWLARTYDLHYCARHPNERGAPSFYQRLIIPVYSRDRELMTWTGRTIREDEDLRYKALGAPRDDRPGPFYKVPTKETLLGVDYLYRVDNPRVLALLEGPWDAWGITTVGRGLGVHATCLFGKTIQEGQLDLLYGLARRFKRVVCLLDPDAAFDRLRLHDQLTSLRVDFPRFTFEAEDAAELSTEQTLALCTDLLI